MIVSLETLKKPWRVEYDGPSRPIIITDAPNYTPGYMLSLQALRDGRWGLFDREVEFADRIVLAVNNMDRILQASEQLRHEDEQRALANLGMAPADYALSVIKSAGYWGRVSARAAQRAVAAEQALKMIQRVLSEVS